MPLWKKTKTTSASSSKEIDVILSSSGVRAPTFIGGLLALEEKGYNIKRISGTSGGAIVAAGYALGFSIEQLKEKTRLVDYQALKDFGIRNLISLRNPSIYSGKPLDTLYKSLFEDATLKDFKIDCKITVVTVDGKRKRIVLDKNTHPNLLVRDAVRMSSSIPFIFPYLKLEGVPVTDGGLVVFDNFDIFPENARPSVCLRPRAGTIRVLTEEPTFSKDRVFIWTLLRVVAEYLVDAVDNQEVVSNEWEKTIIIPTGSITAFDFSLTPIGIDKLIEYGYNAVIQSNYLP